VKTALEFTDLLARQSLNYYDFIHTASQIPEISAFFSPRDLASWRMCGLDVIKLDNGKITLRTRETDIAEQVFCITDIETNGGMTNGTIIEIGAVKVLGGRVIGEFRTMVSGAAEIPPEITELTGIVMEDLRGAPPLASVMEKFRLFLGTAVFVAHNVRFDYDFISHCMSECGFGPLLNRRLCTIELAHRTIAAERYGLGSLKEQLGIAGVHHRAFDDAMSAWGIMQVSLSRLPWHVQTAENLIEYSKRAKSMKIAPKFKE